MLLSCWTEGDESESGKRSCWWLSQQIKIWLRHCDVILSQKEKYHDTFVLKRVNAIVYLNNWQWTKNRYKYKMNKPPGLRHLYCFQNVH